MTLEKALALLSLPREVARHPTSGEPILAGIGRYGAYVQHGKTYANLGRDDDVLEIGANRAIDLIVAKESGAGGARFGGGGAGRVLGEHPEGGQVSVKQGRFGTYVNHGKINATIPKGTDPAGLTLDDAVALLKARAAGGGVIGRLVGQHPDGGPVTVRDGRYGAYVNWGKVNATIPKGTAPDSITLGHALELIAEREGRPAAQPRKRRARRRRPTPVESQGRAVIRKGTAAKAGRQERLSASRESRLRKEARGVEREGQEFGDPVTRRGPAPLPSGAPRIPRSEQVLLDSGRGEHVVAARREFRAQLRNVVADDRAAPFLDLSGAKHGRDVGAIHEGDDRAAAWLSGATFSAVASRRMTSASLPGSRAGPARSSAPAPGKARRTGSPPNAAAFGRRLFERGEVSSRGVSRQSGKPASFRARYPGLWHTASMLLPSGSRTKAP